MKIKQMVFALITLLCFQHTIAQSIENKESTKKQTSGDNFMDMQSKVLTDIFGSDLSGTPNGQSIDFLELLEKMNLSPEQKLEYKNLYYLQARKLTQKQKDSLSDALEKKIRQAQLDEQ